MAADPKKAQPRAAPAQERAGRLEWGHLRFFLEMVRAGSLSRAAQRLGVDRNTVARRVAALEEELGLPLFERGPQGWTQTAAGEVLSALARRVEEDVLALARHADARDREVSGTVRLTTTPHIAQHLLAPELPALRQAWPALVLELAADQRHFDLTRREADLALRMGRPRDAALVTRKVGDVAFAFYAAPAYQAAQGRSHVDFDADCFLGLDEAAAGTPQERWLAREAPQRKVVFRCNSSGALAVAARSGIGVTLLPCFLGDRDPALRRMEGPVSATHEIWLLVHGDLRRTPRVRAVIEWVDQVFERAAPRLAGKLRPER
jgi:DNA-binding transcriptional LysR family regulator